MRVALILIGLAILAVPASALVSCNSAGGTLYFCADMGNPYTNGQDLADFLNAQSFTCGSTIILQAGVSFRATDGASDPFWRMKHQTGCNGKYTTIQSSQLTAIPFGQKQNLISYRSSMPSLEVSNGAAFYLLGDGSSTESFAGPNNWKIAGIRVTTTTYAVDNRVKVGYLAVNMTDFTSAADIARYRPTNFEIDRCIFEEAEELLYGDPTTSNTSGQSFLRSTGVAIGGLPWKNLYMHDSYVKLVGYSNNSAEGGTTALLTITGATAASPAVVQGSGLATSLGITYSAGCVTGTDLIQLFETGFPCEGHSARVVIQGATGSWLPLNGPKYVIALSGGNDVAVFKPNSDFGPSQASTALDASGFGMFTSTSPKIAGARLLTQYTVLLVSCEDVRIIDNHLEAWAMPIFMGGADGKIIDPAVILSGSSATVLNLSHVRGLEVGDVLTFNVPNGSGNSAYCYSSTASCINIGAQIPPYRSGLVTAISGTTVTVIAWGPNGTDGTTPLTAGGAGSAWWQNYRVRNIEIRGNNLSRGYMHPNGDAGKGAIEMKHCEDCLISGNVMNGHLDSSNVIRGNMNAAPYFTEAKSQSGRDSNVRLQNVSFLDNIASGQLPGTGTASCNWRASINLVDDEMSMRKGKNVYIENNLHIGCKAVPGNNLPLPEILSSETSGYFNNTFAPDLQAVNHYFFRIFDCTSVHMDPFEPTYKYNTDTPVKGNIIGYGFGYYGSTAGRDVCFPTWPADVRNNVIVDTQSVGTSTINTAWPNNSAVADYTGMWVGTCAYDSWMNCKVNPSHASYGTAANGRNPGADVEEIKDRIERWSDRAGFLIRSGSRMIPNPGAWKIGSTSAAVKFNVFASSPSACTFQIFTNGNRSTAHADTSSPVACNRTGSYAENNQVTFVAGTASALTASTLYFYKVIDGGRTMVGEFTTQAAGSGTYTSSIRLNTASALTHSLNADLSSGTTLSSATVHPVPAATGTVVYWRLGSAGQRGIIVAK